MIDLVAVDRHAVLMAKSGDLLAVIADQGNRGITGTGGIDVEAEQVSLDVERMGGEDSLLVVRHHGDESVDPGGRPVDPSQVAFLAGLPIFQVTVPFYRPVVGVRPANEILVQFAAAANHPGSHADELEGQAIDVTRFHPWVAKTFPGLSVGTDGELDIEGAVIAIESPVAKGFPGEVEVGSGKGEVGISRPRVSEDATGVEMNVLRVPVVGAHHDGQLGADRGHFFRAPDPVGSHRVIEGPGRFQVGHRYPAHGALAPIPCSQSMNWLGFSRGSPYDGPMTFPARTFVAVSGCLLLSWALSSEAVAGPLKVFVLTGQSNMQGHARVGTLEHLKMDPATEPLFSSLVDDTGSPRVFDEVTIAYLTPDGEKQGKLTVGYGADEGKFGPELTFGSTIQSLIGEPVLIIKTAWGGKSLHTDFRPPGAGPYLFRGEEITRLEKQGKDVKAVRGEKKKATGQYYRLTVDFVKKILGDLENVVPGYDPSMGYELAGFVWFQGWNDMVDQSTYPRRGEPGGYAEYGDLLAQFIRDVRRDLEAPKMPFVIGVLGVGGPVKDYLPRQKRYATIHQGFRDAMAHPATLPEFQGNVRAVLTENCWDRELHLLRDREATINEKVSSLKGLEKRAEKERLMAAEFSEKEREILRVGVSNLEFHYLGSSKIMTAIGRAFAEAAFELGIRPD